MSGQISARFPFGIAGTAAPAAAAAAPAAAAAAPAAGLLGGLGLKGAAGAALAANPLGVGLMAAGALGQFIPSKAERSYRKYLRKERKALDRSAKRGEGGMTPAQRNRAYAESEARIQAQEEQMKAEIARIQDPVKRQQATQKLYEMGMQARSQERSGVRAADIQVLRDRRAAVQGGQAKQAQLGAQSKYARGKTLIGLTPLLATAGEDFGKRYREELTERQKKSLEQNAGTE